MSACTKCGGRVVVVIARAWCVEPYANGGCGSYFALRGGKWEVHR